MFRQSIPLGLAVALCGSVVWASAAGAGGLYLSEFGTSDMGAASSGFLVRGEDAGAAIGNPATMTLLDSHQFHLGLAPGYGRVRFDQDSDTPVPGNNGGNQGGFIPLVSSAYVHKVSDRFRAGLGIYSVSGATLDPKNDWAGRNQVTNIELFTVVINPSVGVRITDWLSIGAGPSITYGKLDWKLRVPLPGGGEGLTKLDDLDDWAVAAKVGILIEPSDQFRVGFVYQSKTDLKLDGSTNLPGPLLGPVDTKVELPLPHAFRADALWQATGDLALTFGGAFEDWSDLRETDVDLGPIESEVHLGFKDSWKLRGGVHYQLNPKWMIQTGLSYDSSALRNRDRTPALPVDEQWRWGIGGTYGWTENTTLGFGFQYTNLGDAKVDNAALKGDYKNNEIFFFMLSLNFAKLPWDGMATF